MRAQQTGSTTRYWLYGAQGGDHPVAEYNGAWQTNIEVGGTTVATVDSVNNVTYLALSLLKTAKMTVNVSGAPSGVATYYPYGAENASITAEYKFTNQRRDPNGIDHFWMRSYAAPLGGWLTPDPAGLAAVDPANPQSWNRYAYVTNSPLAMIDPLGLSGNGCSGATTVIGCQALAPSGYTWVQGSTEELYDHYTGQYWGQVQHYALVPSYMGSGFDGQAYMQSQWISMDFQPNIPNHPTGGGGGGGTGSPDNGHGKPGFWSCTFTGSVGMAWATTALDVVGIIPGGGNVLHGIQLGAAVVATGVSALGDATGAGLSATGMGLTLADKSGVSVAVHGAEMIPIAGNLISAGAALHDIFGSDGMIAAYRSCMSGAS